jgi:phosphoglycerate dehydrogenase-like enzyme
LPVSGLYKEVFTPEADAQLHMLVDVTFTAEDRNISSSELAQKIGGYDAVLTGWGSPRFTDEVLDAADRLQLIAHSAGSIIRLLPPLVFERGINVTHAAAAIAPAVAEMTILLILLCLRQVQKLDSLLKAGEPWPWGEGKLLNMGQELAGSRVGVVGAGHTGRCVINNLHALNAEVWVYDPHLSEERAAVLDVSRVELDQVFADCSVVTIQAPLTAETYHMVGASQLALLRDGAIFVNTARSAIVDESALLAELQTGRIQGALDVFDDEPLSEDSPFRRLNNLIITPHIAGCSEQARHRQGLLVLDEIRRFFSGETLRYRVTKDMLDNMA